MNKLTLTTLLLASVLAGLTHNAFCKEAGIPKPFVQKVVTNQTQINAAQGVIGRTTPQLKDHFILEVIPKKEGLDVFELEQKGSKVVLRGSSGVALCSAYNYYLQKFCKCDVSWCGDQLNIPNPLPQITTKVSIVGLHKYRAYFNYCTLSYTASWWGWERWQREIDFMAMKGINMPLAPTGLEGTWYYALLDMGFTDVEAREFFVGPAHFAWQWMANIQGDPKDESLPKNWIDQHIELGQQIIERERALGMTPIQQGFSGFVPRAFMEKFPEAEIDQEGGWAGFEGTAQLDPLDPLFKKFGKTLIETQTKLFGTSHHYAADPFHESSPPKPGNEYLAKVGGAIYGLMKEVDKDAIWTMQGWTPKEGIIRAVPIGGLLMLDLGGSGANQKNEFFWGHDFVKGQLHNFGGRINLHGDIAKVVRNDYAKVSKKIKTNVGMGLFMEAIEQNPAYYAAVLDQVWTQESQDVNEWSAEYAERRYGAKSENANKAWKLLIKDGPYRPSTDAPEKSSIIAARPAVHVKKSGPNAGFEIKYDPLALVEAWELLLADYDQLKGSDAYLFDLMDVTRQVVSNLGQELHHDVIFAYEAKDKEALKAATDKFLQMLDDVDALLASRTEFSFAKWVHDARAWGDTEEEKAYYEWNASKLVTIWGPSTEPKIFDYAWREWSGLISTYYKPRWQMFYDMLNEKLAKGEAYEDPKFNKWSYNREQFRANDFYNKLADWELAWTKTRHNLSTEPVGDTAEIVKALHKKYRSDIDRVYTAEREAKIKAMKAAAKASVTEFRYGRMVQKLSVHNVKPEWTELTIDVTEHVHSAGRYAVLFKRTWGAAEYDVETVSLLQDKEVMATKKLNGHIGKKSVRTRCILDLPSQALGTPYYLKVKIKLAAVNKNPFTGEVWLKKE